MLRNLENNIIIIEGEKYYILPENSYTSWVYQQSRGDESYNYTYIRLPVEGSTTSYEDRYVTHVHLRDDVSISIDPDGSVSAIWDRYKADPFVNMNHWVW